MGHLADVPGKGFIRLAIERSSGREGVLKHLRGRVRARFYQEALNMRRLNGTPGILPVLDIDDATPTQPRWYAMPRAELLDEGLGDSATLRDVVIAIAYLADILALLAEDGTYHRDIKPANLFFLNGGPVLADFGIAAWRTRRAWHFREPQADETRPNEKIGPANFIAPEMRWGRPADHGRHADAYSLAKSLFVLALPHRGPYPPDGTHRVSGEEFSMDEAGGHQSLGELGYILEAATEFDPSYRLQMPELRDELRAWLRHYHDVQFRRRDELQNYTLVSQYMQQDPRYRRTRLDVEALMTPYIMQIAEALTGDASAWAEDDNAEILGHYALRFSVDDEPEGWMTMATKAETGRRVVLSAVIDGYVSFLAESQLQGPPRLLERQWGGREWARPRMPRTTDQLKEICDNALAWIANCQGWAPEELT